MKAAIKKLLFTFILIVFIFDSLAQHQTGLKLYQNTDIYNVQEVGLNSTEEITVTNFNRVSLALQFSFQNKYVHEIEFFIPEISRPLPKLHYPLEYEVRNDDSFEGMGSAYSFRYEFGMTLTDYRKPLTFHLAAGLNPYFVKIEYSPIVANAYSSSTTFYGATVNIIPRLIYKISNRFSLDLNIPLKFYDLRREVFNVENPQIPVLYQTITETNNIFFEEAYTIRLGLQYNLR